MPHSACADMFWTLTQVVDHSGSAEEGADLIYAQLEKVIKQVQIFFLAVFLSIHRAYSVVIYVHPSCS